MDIINTVKCGFAFILSNRPYDFGRNERKSHYSLQFFFPKIELHNSSFKVIGFLTWPIQVIIFSSILLCCLALK